MLCGGRAPLQLEGPGAVPGEVERRRAPGDDAGSWAAAPSPALAQGARRAPLEPRHRHTRIAAQTGRDLVGVAQDGHVPVGLGHVGRGAASAYSQGVLVAGRPQDVAQRHAQDALVASSHRFCVFLGAARAGHFVHAAAAALFVRTQLMSGFMRLFRRLFIKDGCRWIRTVLWFEKAKQPARTSHAQLVRRRTRLAFSPARI